MRKGTLCYRSARLAGILLLIATVLHWSLGTAELMQGIKVGDVKDSLLPLLKNIWVYSSVMLFLSGIWLLFLAGELLILRRKAWWQAVLIGLGYLGGAIGAMAWAGIQPHLVAFAFIGLVLLVPLLLKAGAFKSDAKLASTPPNTNKPA